MSSSPTALSAAEIERLAVRFVACTLPRAEWTHWAHLVTGLWHVDRYGEAGALAKLQVGIRRLNESHGTVSSATDGYHETITRAYVRLLAQFEELWGVGTSLAQRVAALAGSALADRDVLLRFYSRERLMSTEARLGWLEPDRAPLALSPVLAMTIRRDDLTAPAVQALLAEHLRSMYASSPPESVHALDLDGLRRADVTFWTAWCGDELLGCGALKELDPSHGEIKSMRTAAAHLRKGVARALVTHILAEACRRSYTRLSLETGSMRVFEPARRLYASFGFTYCEPFGDYVDDPNSVFMTRSLADAEWHDDR